MEKYIQISNAICGGGGLTRKFWMQTLVGKLEAEALNQMTVVSEHSELMPITGVVHHEAV